MNVLDLMQALCPYKKNKSRYHYVPLTRIYKMSCKNVRKVWERQLRGADKKIHPETTFSPEFML